jgi:hypothetical protein
MFTPSAYGQCCQCIDGTLPVFRVAEIQCIYVCVLKEPWRQRVVAGAPPGSIGTGDRGQGTGTDAEGKKLPY